MRKYFITTAGESPAGILSAFVADTPAFGPRYRRARNVPDVATGSLEEGEAEELAKRGVKLIASRRYEPLFQPFDDVLVPIETHPHSMNDVLDHIKAPAAWQKARGNGVHVAVIDTGICGKMNEFPAEKRSPHRWSHDGTSAWRDARKHGSMTAAIAAGTKANGGRYDGVAPDATIISCKTTFDESELFDIYDFLLSLVKDQKIGRLVTNNSYGVYTSLKFEAPAKLLDIVRQAADEGIVNVFGAGNNHFAIAQHPAASCGENTIWGLNSLDEVLSVGTVNRENRMSDDPLEPGAFSHRDSSRGPGQKAVNTTKPDCVAPTYGEVLFGCGYQAMEWWGTSGAAPQVAGLAALILELDPTLSAGDVHDIIRDSCTDIGLGATCAGQGLIDCEKAVNAV